MNLSIKFKLTQHESCRNINPKLYLCNSFAWEFSFHVMDRCFNSTANQNFKPDSHYKLFHFTIRPPTKIHGLKPGCTHWDMLV
jgi:hypothetical protein